MPDGIVIPRRPVPPVERILLGVITGRDGPDPDAPGWARALHRDLLRRAVLARLARGRGPDRVVGGGADPYMLRWRLLPRWLPFNAYLHRFVRSDDPRACHDHPWASVSVVLAGGYLEHLGDGRAAARPPGSVVARRASAAHRVELRDTPWGPRPAWSLFLVGPRVREWGFHCPGGRWVRWQDFTADGTGETVGRGCG